MSLLKNKNGSAARHKPIIYLIPAAGVSLFSLLLFILLIRASSLAVLKKEQPTPLIEDRYGTFLSEGIQDDNIGYWAIEEEIPYRLAASLIAIEDKRFSEHGGVDIRAILRSVKNNLSGGPIQGASTLAMQVIRIQHPAARTIGNKLVEMLAAIMITAGYGREAVLRQYLTIMPQGGPYYGGAYSARRFFQKPLEDLSWAEAALLASLPRSPGTMNLFTPLGFSRARRRAFLVLDLLEAQDMLVSSDAERARSQLSEMGPSHKESRNIGSYHYLLRLLENQENRQNQENPQNQENQESPQDQVSWESSLTAPVRSSLDLPIQNQVEAILREEIEQFEDWGAGNAAVIVCDVHTGEILSYVGSVDYWDLSHKGQINYAFTQRSPGSTLKPFIYELGLETGLYTPASIIPDLPLNLLDPGGIFIVDNYDEGYLGPMLYRRALANSRNTPAIRLTEALGLYRTFNHFEQLGLTNGRHGAEYYGYGMAIGGIYLTLEDLVKAYGVLANNGEDYQFSWLITEEEQENSQLIEEDASRQINLFLSDSAARLPSFERLNNLEFSFPVAIKTGTSQGFRDAWTLAYSADYLVGVWVGEADNATMNHLSGSDAAIVVQRVMNLLHPKESSGIEFTPFSPPDNTFSLSICTLSGQKATANCESVSVEYFTRENQPLYDCQVHRLFAVDKTTGFMAGQYSRPQDIELRVFPVLGPEYSLWAARNNLLVPQGFSVEQQQASLVVTSPLDGGRYIIDPEIPSTFQTLSLRAEVSPSIEEIIWEVDGMEYIRASYPYEVRWPLQVGRHTILARFPGASVESSLISIEITGF